MKQAKLTSILCIGAILEHYDLLLYSLLASFISQQFFPGFVKISPLFSTISIFALSSILRPFSGFIFGSLGDKLGRKYVVTNTMLLLSIITFCMGLIPTYKTIGLLAPLLLSIGKILQSLVLGAEIPSALTMLLEYTDKKQQGLHFGFLTAASGLGVPIGSIVIAILTYFLSDAQMLNWGFRIPFLLGGGLAIVSHYIRKYIPENHEFIKKTKIKITKEHFGQIVKVVGMIIFPVCLMLFCVFIPTYLNKFYGFPFPKIYLAMTCAYLWGSLLIPIFGIISDHIGTKLLLITSSIIMIILGHQAFSLLNQHSSLGLFTFIFFLQTVVAIASAAYFVLIPKAFPENIRCTGSSLSYNIAHKIAALMSLVTTYIYETTKHPEHIATLFIILATITIISTITICIKEN